MLVIYKPAVQSTLALHGQEGIIVYGDIRFSNVIFFVVVAVEEYVKSDDSRLRLQWSAGIRRASTSARTIDNFRMSRFLKTKFSQLIMILEEGVVVSSIRGRNYRFAICCS